MIRPGEESGFVAECLEVPVVTEGGTLHEVVRNLTEAVELQLEGEDQAHWGLVTNPRILITYEVEPVSGKA